MNTILLVEDDPLISHNLTRALGTAGYRVVAARTAADGYQLASAEHFDLMLFDIGLPDGNGLELAQQLRREKNLSPFIFLTAYEDEQIVEQAIACGAHSYLVKPVATRQLLPLIATALASLERHTTQTNTLISAIERSRTVSAAAGILAERKQWTTDAAFDAMRRWSRQHEIKIEAVAQQIVDGEINTELLT
jgi:response regulator NasT